MRGKRGCWVQGGRDKMPPRSEGKMKEGRDGCHRLKEGSNSCYRGVTGEGRQGCRRVMGAGRL